MLIHSSGYHWLKRRAVTIWMGERLVGISIPVLFSSPVFVADRLAAWERAVDAPLASWGAGRGILVGFHGFGVSGGSGGCRSHDYWIFSRNVRTGAAFCPRWEVCRDGGCGLLLKGKVIGEEALACAVGARLFSVPWQQFMLAHRTLAIHGWHPSTCCYSRCLPGFTFAHSKAIWLPNESF